MKNHLSRNRMSKTSKTLVVSRFHSTETTGRSEIEAENKLHLHLNDRRRCKRRAKGAKLKHGIKPFVYFCARQGENIFHCRSRHELPLKMSSLSCCTNSMQLLPLSIISALHVLQHEDFCALRVHWKREASV